MVAAISIVDYVLAITQKEKRNAMDVEAISRMLLWAAKFTDAVSKRKNFETGVECTDFPCSRFKGAWEGYDSVLTQRRMRPNLTYTREKSVKDSIPKLEKRMIA